MARFSEDYHQAMEEYENLYLASDLDVPEAASEEEAESASEDEGHTAEQQDF